MSNNETAVDLEQGGVRPAPVLDGEWLSATRAAPLLGCDGRGLVALALTGQLDLVLIDGQMLVSAADARALAHARLDGALAGAVESAARWEQTLAAYLDARPVAFTLDDARRGGRPLVMRRRGNPQAYRHGDITRYGVAVHVDDFTEFARTRVGRELDHLPSRGGVRSALLGLGGVAERHWITPLLPSDGPSTRVRTWVDIDPVVWRLFAPPDLTVVGPDWADVLDWAADEAAERGADDAADDAAEVDGDAHDEADDDAADAALLAEIDAATGGSS